MPNDSLFRRLESDRAEIRLSINGEAMTARAGDSVAACLLAHGLRENRSTVVSASPRAAYCLMGVCFECLVEIDGVANQQACMIQAREGMVVRSQLGAPQAEVASA